MKSLFILLMLILGYNINAQDIPNLTTPFSDITDEMLLWETNEGDVVLYKYSRYDVILPNSDKIEPVESPLWIKLFYNESRNQLRSVITAFDVDDVLETMEYTIYVEQWDMSEDRMIDGNMVFNGEDKLGNKFTLALIPEKPSISVYIGTDYPKGTHSIYLSAVDNISRASFEEVIKNATKQDWRDRYKR